MNDDRSETSAKHPSDIPDIEKASLPEDDSKSDEKNDAPTEQYANSLSVIVDWDGPDDPEKPSNFPRSRKFAITIALAMMTLTTTFSSSIFSAAIPETTKRFNASVEVMTLGTSLWVLGIGLGPPVWGPLSELYGRKIPLFTGFIIFAIFQIPAAVAENLQSVLIFRFLQGLFGSSPPAVVGGSLADFWDARERGFAAPTFAGALFIGPLLGPIVGAFITDSYLGWRWTQWITLIMAAFLGTVAFFVIPETYAPVLLSRRAKLQRHRTGNWALHAKHEERVINLKEIGEKYLTRPARMMILEPILLLITIYLAFIYGLIYLFFVAYPVSFREARQLSPGTANLPFLAIFVGVLCGCALLATTTRTKWAPNPQEGRYQETRLLFMALAGIVLPIGLFWFAWTSFPSINPWPQIVAGVPIGFGIMVITLQGLNYIIDCYTFNANSALAANTFVRALFGAGFPMFANAMFHNLGVQWATSVLAFIAVALIPVPILFFKFGAKIRSYSKYTPT